MKEKIYYIVKQVVIEILSNENKTLIDENAILYGSNGLFDSMDLVNFISLLEENLFIQLKINIQLSHASIFSNKSSPFRNIYSITDFVLSLL